MAVKLPEEEKETWKERSNSMSGRLRRIVEAWNEAEDEYGVREDFEGLNLVVLKSYRNAIDKNISAMKAQRDKLDKEIEKLEEDEGEEILFKVELDLEGQHL